MCSLIGEREVHVIVLSQLQISLHTLLKAFSVNSVFRRQA